MTLTVPRYDFGSGRRDLGGDIRHPTGSGREARHVRHDHRESQAPAGITAADGYTDVMSTQITDYYDIVFFNQRGVRR